MAKITWKPSDSKDKSTSDIGVLKRMVADLQKRVEKLEK